MKKIFLILILSISTNMFFGQEFPIGEIKNYTESRAVSNNGEYFKDTQGVLNPYIGTWKYIGNGVEFTLKIQRVDEFLSNITGSSSYCYYDTLLVSYKLVKNNTIIVDNLHFPIINNLMGLTTYNYSMFDNYLPNENSIQGLFVDITNNVYVDAIIKRQMTLFNEPAKIHFKAFVNSNTSRRNPREFYQGMSTILSIPGDVILTKIN